MRGKEMWRKTQTAKPMLTQDDLQVALDAACRGSTPPIETAVFATALRQLNQALDRLISASEGPHPKEIARVATQFETIAASCRDIILTLGAKSASDDPEASFIELSSWLRNSLEPLALGLLDGARSSSGHEQPAEIIALILLGVDQLGTWSREAAVRYAAGAKLEARRRADAPARTPAREFGFALITAYHDLTKAPIAHSRGGDTAKSRKPTGPLIRFMNTMFAQTRSLLARRPDLSGLVEDLELRPTDESFVVWIKAMKALRQASSADRW